MTEKLDLGKPTELDSTETMQDGMGYMQRRMQKIQEQLKAEGTDTSTQTENKTTVHVERQNEVVIPTSENNTQNAEVKPTVNAVDDKEEYFKKREAELLAREESIRNADRENQERLQLLLKAQENIVNQYQTMNKPVVETQEVKQKKTTKAILKEYTEYMGSGDVDKASELLEQLDEAQDPYFDKFTKLEKEFEDYKKSVVQIQEQRKQDTYDNVYSRYSKENPEIFADADLKEMLDNKIYKYAQSGAVSTIEDLFSKATAEVKAFRNKYVQSTNPNNGVDESEARRVATATAIAVNSGAQTPVDPNINSFRTEDKLTMWRKARLGLKEV